MDRGEHAYVSVIAWPNGLAGPRLAELLVDACGLDPFHAALRVAKPPPMVVARMHPAAAQAGVARLRSRGVTAFAPTDRELTALPRPVLLKSVAPAVGAPRPMFLAEVWRGESLGLLADEIRLLVRGKVAKSERGPDETETAVGVNPWSGHIEVTTTTVATARTNVSDMIDLALADGRRLRINGDKFNFAGLGRDRGLSDAVNADRLCLMLAEAAPQAMLDTAFNRFHAATGVLSSLRGRLGADGVVRRDDHPLFDFYSAWCTLMYNQATAGPHH